MIDLNDAAIRQTIFERSAAGDGVAAILKDMGTHDVNHDIDWLARHHWDDLKAAKKQQIAKREKEAKDGKST